MNEFDGQNTLSEILRTVGEPANASMAVRKPDNFPMLAEDDEILDLGEDFDFDGFQVVRREFFAHMREPSCTFNNCKFYVNAACLSKFPNFDYAQVLINRQKKILALRPCEEGS